MSKRDYRTFYVRLLGYIVILQYCFFGTIQDEWTICTFRNVTGFLCYTCGMTRAFMSFFRFDIHSAMEYNPLVFLFVGIFLFVMIDDIYIFIKNIRHHQNQKSFIKSLLF